ncbi:MAG: hypothetical protein K2J15_07200 [Muribaculaceae bacterium]|nr:hypothetical protein [Muribaculaceae bacterium]
MTMLITGACDEGRIHEDESLIHDEGRVARVIAGIKGTDTWTDGYTLAIAGFEEGNEFAIVSKNIISSAISDRCDIILSGIPQEVSTVEICALDRLRRRVATFLSVNTGASRDTLTIDVPEVNLSMADAIQKEIFNTTCAQCHGGSAYAAAGLNLTEGRSFGEMIGVESYKQPGMERVMPGNSKESVLYLILGENMSSTWRYDHSVEVIRQEKLDLIRNWIDGGANPN